jgi:GDP-L-fucose synthase
MIDLATERIVITGGDGFLGRHLQRAMRTAGAANIMVPTIEQYDLTDAQAVRKMYQDMKPTVVIHLAAQVGGIGANRENPGRFFYSNMAMGLHMIEQARIFGIKKFVQLGTVCAYPKFTAVPFKEDDLWDGYPEETNAPYGIAKKALLVMLQGYRQQYGLNGVFLLPVNLYGPGDNFNPASSHVIPALIRKFVLAKRRGDSEVVVWGTGSASREFLYVEDCARAITLATQNYDGPDPVNLGSGFEVSIRSLVEKLGQMVGFEGKIVWDSTKPDGQPRRCLDTSRAEKLFAFKAQTSLDEGLRKTIDWAVAQQGMFDR